MTRHATHTASPHRSRPRSAFTLVELMIAISIIAVLIALLVPAVGGAITRARIAQVKTEIAGFENAIADFKVKYGTEPPSSIVLSEDQSWTPDAKGKLRAIFGNQFDFSVEYDFNQDGDKTDQITLNGAQCLVFFLGGPILDGTCQGFSKNPRKPFAPLDVASPTLSGERVGPFFEVESARLEKNGSSAIATYKAPNDYGAYLDIHHDDYRDAAGSGVFNGVPGFSDGAYRESATANQSFHKPKSFQIIAAGIDNDFGSGGEYQADNPGALSTQDRDNITNFSQGTLAN